MSIKKSMQKSKIISSIIIIMIFVGGVSLSVAQTGSKEHVKIIKPSYAADFSNDKALVGASHNIFAGKVMKQIGTKERGIGPETQFSVEVIDNIKGDLSGIVTLNQEGGYRDGVLYIVGGDENSDDSDILAPSHNKETYLLQAGSTYLFATRYNKEENWYTLNSYPAAKKLLSSDVNMSKAALKDLAEDNWRVKALKSVYPKEILLDADVKNSNTLNSFKSISENIIR
jgi:hypothetical protein